MSGKIMQMQIQQKRRKKLQFFYVPNRPSTAVPEDVTHIPYKLLPVFESGYEGNGFKEVNHYVYHQMKKQCLIVNSLSKVFLMIFQIQDQIINPLRV